MNTSIVPVYVSECTRAKRRGRAVAMQLSIVIVSRFLYACTTVADPFVSSVRLWRIGWTTELSSI